MVYNTVTIQTLKSFLLHDAWIKWDAPVVLVMNGVPQYYSIPALAYTHQWGLAPHVSSRITIITLINQSLLYIPCRYTCYTCYIQLMLLQSLLSTRAHYEAIVPCMHVHIYSAIQMQVVTSGHMSIFSPHPSHSFTNHLRYIRVGVDTSYNSWQ